MSKWQVGYLRYSAPHGVVLNACKTLDAVVNSINFARYLTEPLGCARVDDCNCVGLKSQSRRRCRRHGQ